LIQKDGLSFPFDNSSLGLKKLDLSEKKISIVKKVIESKEYYMENDRVFFEGWTGALQFIA